MKTFLKYAFWVQLSMFALILGSNAEVSVSFNFDNFNGLEFSDSTGYGLQGEIVSSALSRPTRIPGVSGAANDFAVSFSGEGALVAIDDETLSLDIFPPFTIELWARTTEADQANTAWFSYGFPDNSTQSMGGFRFGLVGGNLVFSMYGVVDVESEVSFPADGEWHHAAAAFDYDQGVVRFFLDGEEQQVVEAIGDIQFPGRTELSIGEVSPGFLQYIGDIDRIRVTDGVLSAAELDADPTSAKTVTNDTYVYFSFEEVSGNYASQGSNPSLEAVPVIDLLAQGVVYQRIPKTAEIVADTPSGNNWDRAILFTGQEFALVQDPDGVLDFPGDWTLEAWIKPQFVEGRSNAMVMYAYGAPGGGHSLQLAYSDNDPTRLNVRGTAVGILDIAAPGTFVTYDEWQHVAVAHRDGESMTFFLNGELSEVIEYTGGMNPRANELLYIGTWPNALDFAFVGTLDRIRFSDSALSAEELDSDPSTVTQVNTWSLY